MQTAPPPVDQQQLIDSRNQPSKANSKFERKQKKHQAAINGFDVREKSPITNGLVLDRRPTDVLFCLIFVAFMLSMVGMGVYSFFKGSIQNLVAFQDGNHRMCGVSEGVKDFPYLYLPDLDDDADRLWTQGVCVKKCPEKTGDIDCAPLLGSQSCKFGYPRYDTVPLVSVCIPPSVDDLPPEAKAGYEELKNELTNSSGGRSIEDIYEASWSILLAALVGMILTIIYMYLMSFATTLLAYISILVIEIFFLGGGAALVFTGHNQHSQDAKTGFYVGGGCLLFFGLLFNLMLCCFWKKLKVAIAVIDATADFFVATKRLVFVSIFYFFVSVICFLVWVACFALVISLCKITPDVYSHQGKNFEATTQVKVFAPILVFGLIWGLLFIKDKTIFICMSSAASYYFSSGPLKEGSGSVMRSFKFAYFKHAGSIALGSLLHAIFTVIRMMMESLADSGRHSDNAAAKIVAAIALCCARCLEDLIEYLSKLAYAFMAVSGQSYCTSAWNGFLINLKHCVKFYFANQLAAMFIFIGSLMIVSLNCGFMYVSMNYIVKDVHKVYSLAGPMIVVAFLTLITTAIFLGLFDEAVLATIHCMAIDMDLNNGKPEFGPPSFHQKIQEIFHDEDGDPKKVYAAHDAERNPNQVIATYQPVQTAYGQASNTGHINQGPNNMF